MTQKLGAYQEAIQDLATEYTEIITDFLRDEFGHEASPGEVRKAFLALTNLPPEAYGPAVMAFEQQYPGMYDKEQALLIKRQGVT